MKETILREDTITRERLATIKFSVAGAVAATKHHSCKDVYTASNALLEDVILPLTERCGELIGRAEKAESALLDAVERCAFLERVAEQMTNRQKHDFWGAGEPDCPKEIKAPNGELHTLRCKLCGGEDYLEGFCPPGPDASQYLQSKSASDAGQENIV